MSNRWRLHAQPKASSNIADSDSSISDSEDQQLPWKAGLGSTQRAPPNSSSRTILTWFLRLVKLMMKLALVYLLWIVVVIAVSYGTRYWVLNNEWSDRLVNDHVRAENFTSVCPPNWRHYPCFQSVLGLPPPLYPGGGNNDAQGLLAPRLTVRKAYRNTLKCWHPDKRSRYPFLSDEQWREIRLLVEDSHTKLTMGEDAWPRYGWAGNNQVDLREDKRWKKRVNVRSVELYPETCTCTWRKAIERSVEEWAVTNLNDEGSNASVPHDAEISKHCPCTVSLLLQMHKFFFMENLPLWWSPFYWWSSSPLFSSTPTVTTDPLSILLNWIFHYTWKTPYIIAGPCAHKKKLVANGWALFEVFGEDCKPGGCLADMEEASRRRRREEVEERRRENFNYTEWRKQNPGSAQMEDIISQQRAEEEKKRRRDESWLLYLGYKLGISDW